MNPEVVLYPDLVAWLVRDDHELVAQWEPEPPAAELQCEPRLVARLSEIARSVPGTGRRFVAGCPVIEHVRGRSIAAACSGSWLAIRSAMEPGALAPTSASGRARVSGLGRDWVELDPWAANSAFARATDLLRAHMARAYERADAAVGS